MNIVDLSNRRGAIVHLLPQVYALMKADGHDLPNIILWTHDMNKKIVDINRKWIFALQGTKDVRGAMLYRLDADGRSVYIDAILGGSGLFDALIKKFEQDALVKAREAFYVGRNIKREAAEEAFEAVGLADDSVFNAEGYQLLGGLSEAAGALKLRYTAYRS